MHSLLGGLAKGSMPNAPIESWRAREIVCPRWRNSFSALNGATSAVAFSRQRQLSLVVSLREANNGEWLCQKR